MGIRATAVLLALIPTILHATPTLSTPVIMPSTVVVNQATQVTATCQLTTSAGDPTLLAGGMNLVRLTAAGADATVLGAMTAGTNGIYSYTFSDTETATGQYQLQCTAAFAATIGRVRSASATVTATTPTAAPPTITGISPLSGTIGALVTVTGANLISSTGTAASITLAAQSGGTIAAPLSVTTATIKSNTAATECDDGVGAADSPEHAGLFEADHGPATGFDHAGANEEVLD